MSLKQTAIVAGNRLCARLWGMALKRGMLSYDHESVMCELTVGKSWDEFWPAFKNDFPNRFFYSPLNRKEFFLQTLQTLHSYEEILDDARSAASWEFDLLGSGPKKLEAPLAWNVDFKTGAAWTNAFYTWIIRGNRVEGGDIKVPWELGRFQFLTWLGKGYWVSGSRVFVDAFRDSINGWIDANPLGHGIQWSNAMEVSIRACNWISGMAFMLDEPTLDDTFWQRVLVALWNHAEFIENNLEVTRRSGNHLIADYTGLVFLGALFRHTIEGERWFIEGMRGMERELLRQTNADGVDYEQSIAYHRFVAEMALDVMLLCKHLRAPFPNDVAKRIEKMCEFAMHYTRPDGSVPNIGDNDNGRLFRVRSPENFLNHGALLSTAAVVFERTDFKNAANTFAEESLWLTGTAGWERFRALGSAAPLTSHAFPDSGWYVMRTPTLHCIVDAGELGKKGWGGHGHNDTLSFELWRGAPIIVDSGTFCYTSDAAARNAYRSTAAHNTAMIDGKEIAEFAGSFKIIADDTRPEVSEWKNNSDNDILTAAHHAYARLEDPVVHQRTFTVDKKNDAVTIRDEFICKKSHDVRLSFHFDPLLEVALVNGNTAGFSHAGVRGELRLSSPLTIEECSISPSYGIHVPSRKAVCNIFITGKTVIESVILFQ